MHIRTATLTDVHGLGVFFQEAWKEAGPDSPGFTGAIDEVMRELASEKTLRAKLAEPALRIFVAEDEGRILGFASIKRIDSAEAELSGIVVLKSLEGRGIGSELFGMAREFAVAEGYRKMLVKTEVFNKTAISFYKKQGFVERMETTEKVEGTEVKLMILEKSLP